MWLHLCDQFPNVRRDEEAQVEALLEVCGYIYMISFLVSEGMKKHPPSHPATHTHTGTQRERESEREHNVK